MVAAGLSLAFAVVVAATGTPVATASIEGPAAPAPCRPVWLFAAAGSGADVVGAVGGPLAERLGDRLRVVTAPPPPAGTSYAAAQQEAVGSFSTTVSDVATRCPTAKLLLVGFSEGAHVAGDLASRIGTGQERSIPAERILAVGLFGDPARSPFTRVVPAEAGGQGVLPVRAAGFGSLDPRTIEICAPEDPVCDSPAQAAFPSLEEALKAPVHTSYPQLPVARGLTSTQWAVDSLVQVVDATPDAAGGPPTGRAPAGGAPAGDEPAGGAPAASTEKPPPGGAVPATVATAPGSAGATPPPSTSASPTTTTSAAPPAAPTTSAAPATTSSGAAQQTTTSGGAAAQTTTSGGGAAEPTTSSGAAQQTTTSGGAAARTPTSGGAAARTPTSGGGAAQATTSGGGAAEPTTSGGAAAEPTTSGGAAAETTSGDAGPGSASDDGGGAGEAGKVTDAVFALAGTTGFDLGQGGNVENGEVPVAVESPNVPGRQAVKMELPAGGKRSEVRPEDAAQDIQPGERLFFGYSAFLPEDFPTDFQGFQVVWQLHDGETNTSPPVALEVQQGKLWLANVGDLVQDLGPVGPGENLSVQMEIEFAIGGGTVSLWRDGNQVLDRFQPPQGTMIDGFNFLKTGVYRDEDGAPPLSLFLNDLKIGDSLESVSGLAGAGAEPGGGPTPTPATPGQG